MERDPDLGYYGRNLWLPKKHINVRSAKAGLEFPVMGETGIEYLQLWVDKPDHLVVPREYVQRSVYQSLPFGIVPVLPLRYRHINFSESIVLDKKDPTQNIQRDAFKAFMAADCGILNLACGRGKTVLTLKRIAARQIPAIVIMNNTTLIGQWRNQIEKHMQVEGGIGIVQGNPSTWDWEGRGIVLASLMTVAIRYQELPPGFSSYFGDIYYDEVHHLSAEVFSRACPMFYGNRYGLTATTKREDGLELVYQYNIGPVFFKYLRQDLVPKIYFHTCPVKINMASVDVKIAITDKNNKPCLPRLRSYLGTMVENNNYISAELRRPLAAGRKVLALSHSVDQLQVLHQAFRGSGLCIGDVKDIAQRLRALRECQITFGTLDLVREGLDEDTLDTIFFLTPFGSKDIVDGGKNTFQQGMGRALRPRKGKRRPVIVVIDHLYIPKLHQQCNKMKQLLRDWPEDEGGPFEFEVIKAYEEIK